MKYTQYIRVYAFVLVKNGFIGLNLGKKQSRYFLWNLYFMFYLSHYLNIDNPGNISIN